MLLLIHKDGYYSLLAGQPETSKDTYSSLMWLFFSVAPVAITLMIAAVVIEMQDPWGQLIAMFQYFITVFAAEVFHFFITMPLIFWIFTRSNPYKYMYGCLKALGMAFASNNR